MKRLIAVMCIAIMGIMHAQEVKPTFEKEGNLVKATYYYTNGNVKQQGYFKNKKLTGTWLSYDDKGLKTSVAHYKNGKKTGKWIVWSSQGIKEVTYNNNKIVAVEAWKGELNADIASKQN